MSHADKELVECLAWEVANAQSPAALVAVEREAHRLSPAARALIGALLWQVRLRHLNVAMAGTLGLIARLNEQLCRQVGAAIGALPTLPALRLPRLPLFPTVAGWRT